MNTTSIKKKTKPFEVFGNMSWASVKIGAYKTIGEANNAIKDFESRKIYTNVHVKNTLQ